MKLYLLTAATVLGLGTVAMASTDLDTDGDGAVTWEEVQAGHPEVTEEQFIAMDANGDGALDADELAAAREGGQLPENG
ncbi:MAG TPA: hypothetical protein DEA05_09915 [Rhodobacteraceae bacterium]|nr:hypothetical protein [Paracoccaceae bacterium]